MWVGVGLVVVMGVVLRALVLSRALGVLDADEATTGLVARHFLHNGEHPVFYWSSNYGGTLEAVVTAGAFALFGSSVLVLKVVAVAWYAAGCALTWRVGRRLVSDRVGAVAALLMWVWPASYLWWSTKSRGFYGALLVLGLVIALTALRVAESPRRWLDWLAMGLAVGLGWWTSPQIMVLAVPVGVWLLARNWRAVRFAWIAVPGMVVGAAPWLAWNLRHDFASFDVPPQPVTAPYLERLRGFWTEGLPMATGLRVPYAMAWVKPWVAALYPVLLVAVAVAVVVRWRRTGVLLVGTVVLFSVLYALNPLTVGSVDGRYVFILAPVIALLVAAVVVGRAGVVAMTAAVGLSGLGLTAMHNGNTFYASDRPVPISLSPLVQALDAEGLRSVVADYSIAYRLAFETDERIIAVGAPYNRYQPYVDRLNAGPAPGWVFLTGSTADRNFRAALDGKGERYRVRTAGEFAVYVLETRYRPGELPSG